MDVTREEQVAFLNKALLAEMPRYQGQAAAFGPAPAQQRRLLRSLMNLRPPRPRQRYFWGVLDARVQAYLA